MKQPKKCGGCMYFSPQHQCCTTRIEKGYGSDVLVAVTETSPACSDINKPDLRDFLNIQRTTEGIPMTDNDDRDWRGIPVVQVIVQPEGLQIIGTGDGLCDLVSAIASALAIGASSCDLVMPDSTVYPVTIHRRDFASQWDRHRQANFNPDHSIDQSTDLDDLNLDYRDNF